jgi:hypothetical protein
MLKASARKSLSLMKLFGIDLQKFHSSVTGLPSFMRDYREIKRQLKQPTNLFPIGRLYPCLDDKFSYSGTASGHYFHQDLLVASKIFQRKPERHVDVGSRVDGFVAHVACFRSIEVLDIRAQASDAINIKFITADVTSNRLDLDCYCDSVSSLHAIEHFGLGRYGDSIDLNGHLKALDNIFKMLIKGGKFYFSVPIGPQRIEFNAHRVFSLRYLINLLEDRYYIDSFSFVDDRGDLHKDVELAEQNIENNLSCYYGCGIFELTKR